MKAEELTPKDLRIGNLVNYKYFNPHPENPEYCFTKVVIRGVYENSIRISFPKQKHIEKVSKVYGIPLSEEVLLKCGFEKVEVEIEDYYSCTYEKQLNNDVFISYADDFSCTLHWNKKESINGFGVIPNCHSIDTVHGLQNLCYILTGEELEVSL